MSEIKFTSAAIQNIEETSADVAADVAALRSGAHTRESLLAHCLDGADDDRAQGWHEYVDAVVAAAAAPAVPVSEIKMSDAHRDGTCLCAEIDCTEDHVGAESGHCECGAERFHCECGEIMGEACAWSGPISETVVVEYMPDHLRSSHLAAGNSGRWPHNGAARIRVERTCAARVTHVWVDGDQTDDLDEWVSIVEAR